MVLQVGRELALLRSGDLSCLLRLTECRIRCVQHDCMQLAQRDVLRFGDVGQSLTMLEIAL